MPVTMNDATERGPKAAHVRAHSIDEHSPPSQLDRGSCAWYASRIQQLISSSRSSTLVTSPEWVHIPVVALTRAERGAKKGATVHACQPSAACLTARCTLK